MDRKLEDLAKYAVETAREIVSIPLFYFAKKSLDLANRIAPEPQVEDPGDGYPVDWQEETPDVTRWRHMRQQGRAPVEDEDWGAEGQR